MYGVVSGSVRLLLLAQEHGPYFAHLLQPGNWFGDGPAMTGQPRLVTLTAARPTTLLYLARHDIQEINRNDPEAWVFFMMSMTNHLGLALSALADSMIRDDTRRLVAILLRLGDCRNSVSGEAVEVDADQSELAAMANVARNTAGTILRKLRDAGHLQLTYDHIKIVSPQALRRLLITDAVPGVDRTRRF
jgi:CRP-like cAMP-binding protein